MIRRLSAFLALAALGTLDVQAAMRPAFPSLARRPAESADKTQAPQPEAPAPVATADPALATEVAGLAGKASVADASFQSQLQMRKATVSAASGAALVSEKWVAAQMAISDLDAARYESIAALASLDTLHVDHMNNPDVARVAADLAAIDPARAQVLALVDAQNDTLDALKGKLVQP